MAQQSPRVSLWAAAVFVFDTEFGLYTIAQQDGSFLEDTLVTNPVLGFVTFDLLPGRGLTPTNTEISLTRITDPALPTKTGMFGFEHLTDTQKRVWMEDSLRGSAFDFSIVLHRIDPDPLGL